MKSKFFKGKLMVMLSMIILAIALTYLSVGSPPKIEEVTKEIDLIKY